MKLLNGDCLDNLKELGANSVDSLVTDPPAGISFMGKSWDDDRGGRDHWIKWMSEVMSECLRVLKPGAHGLVWSLPRTSHWTAMALEDAGFEVRDCVSHLFGSGFPKSHNIAKATGESKYDGWGTALKPAQEMWWLVRKPLSEKTVAANVQKWGCGGINIDAGRIKYQSEKDLNEVKATISRLEKSNNEKKVDKGWKNASKKLIASDPSPGRFPANLVFSHTPYCTDEQCDLECAIKQLDEQSGNASRFFFNSNCDKQNAWEEGLSISNANTAETASLKLLEMIRDSVQSLAANAGDLVGKQLSNTITPFTNAIASVLSNPEKNNITPILNIGERCLLELKLIGISKHSHASHAEITKLIGTITTILNLLKSNGFAELATLSITPPNLEHGAKDSSASRFIYCAKISSSERNAGLDKFYSIKLDASLCKDVSTELVLLTLKAIFGSMQSLSIAECGDHITVTSPKDSLSTILTMIQRITELKTWNWLIHSLTSDCTQDVSCEKEFGGSLVVCVENLKGLMMKIGTLPEKDGSLLVDAAHATYQLLLSAKEENAWSPMTNGHPTLKTRKLMSYLIRLITPPSGIVLDPFMGSGSTGIAAKECGFDFIGIEKEKEYFEIARARIG